MEGLVLAAWLVAYNNLANLWGPFNGWAYVPVNTAVAVTLVALALGPLRLTPEAMGLTGNDPAGVSLAAGLALVIAAPILAAAGFRRSAPWIADERVADLSRFGIAYQTLVRVPLGTALLEEVAFRGVLYASLREFGTPFAAIVSSAAFALWHISPTLNLVGANRPTAGTSFAVAAVLGALAFTFGVGLLFVWLRVATGGIAAPFALHALVNSLATVAAVLAHRRLAG